MPYSLKEISEYFHGSKRTLTRRISELKKKGEFKKESPGYYYTEKEVQKLAEKLEFTFTNGKQQ